MKNFLGSAFSTQQVRIEYMPIQHLGSVAHSLRMKASGVAIRIGFAMVCILGGPVSRAQTYTVLHTFSGGADGAQPYASLTLDPTGNVFGTTICGGASVDGPCGGTGGAGVIFKLDSKGRESVVYRFNGGSDGGIPQGSLVLDSFGNLYGAAQVGGNWGYGVAFRVDQAGNERVLHSFGGIGGKYPQGVTGDGSGNLCGVTGGGYRGTGGNVFELNLEGETVLYNFLQTPPYAGVVKDQFGNLYGNVGMGEGAVFKLDPTGIETILHVFDGNADGAWPQAPPILDEAGNLYGTTELGGSKPYPAGSGVVFKLDPAGVETVLYTFQGGADGGRPWSNLTRDSAGNFYGTTSVGGAWGYGTIFKLDTTGKETVLYSFRGKADGREPYAGLVQDAAGNLYGVTPAGGMIAAICPKGCGVLFRLAL